MKVMLKDGKCFRYLKGDKVIKKGSVRYCYGRFEVYPVTSINMSKYTDNTFSNNYCPVTKIIKRNDVYFALIDNNLVPTGIYSDVLVEINSI